MNNVKSLGGGRQVLMTRGKRPPTVVILSSPVLLGTSQATQRIILLSFCGGTPSSTCFLLLRSWPWSSSGKSWISASPSVS